MRNRDAGYRPTYRSILLLLLVSIAGAVMMIGIEAPLVTAHVNDEMDLRIVSRSGEPILPAPEIPGSMPGRGKLLIASRNMQDPRFRETVVLVVDYGMGGAAGLIINRPLDVRLSELIPDLPMIGKRKDKAFYGGPVEGNKLFLLIRSTKNIEESSKVLAGVHMSTSRTVLEHMISGKQGIPFRVYVGYAGWGSGQLDAEITRGDWHVMKAEARMIFERDPAKLWPELIRLSSAIQV
jgi:putative transcriptional regulator